MKTQAMKEAFLKQLPLFAHLTVSSLAALANNLERRVYVKNEMIFQEGKKAEHLFMVFAGQVKIFKINPEGKEHTLHVMPQYSILAEVPMFEGGKYPASGRAMTDVILLALPRLKLINLIQNDPKVALNMLALQAKRLKEFTRKIEQLSLQNTEQKLVNYLLQGSAQNIGEADKSAAHTDGVNYESKLNIQELASYLGTTRENLSRIISKLVHDGVIAKDSKKITILNVTALRELLHAKVHEAVLR